MNLYALAALPPGERKSAVVGECKAPLENWARDAEIGMRDKILTASSDRKSLEKIIESKRGKLGHEKDPVKRQAMMDEIKNMESKLPEVPVPPRLFADDVTPESLAVLMSQQNERIGIMEAEGGVFETLAGRYSNGVPNIDLFLKAWNGEPVTVDRKNGGSFRLDRPLLTMCISAQPDVVANLASKPGFKGRGLLARFIYVMPKSLVGYRNAVTTSIRVDVKNAYAEQLYRVLQITPLPFPMMGTAPHPIGLTPEAEDMRLMFTRYIEEQLREGGDLETLREWASKLPGNTLRIAGLLHCFTLPEPRAAPISGESMYAALVIASVLIQHAKRAFALMGDDPNIECGKKILGSSCV